MDKGQESNTLPRHKQIVGTVKALLEDLVTQKYLDELRLALDELEDHYDEVKSDTLVEHFDEPEGDDP